MKCLLTGGSGNLGVELKKLSSKYNITYFSTSRAEFNINDLASMRNYLFNNYNDLRDVSCVVHCAAYTDVPGSEIYKKEAVDTNVIGTKNVREIFCERTGISLVYISTDYVYPGLTGNYKEEDATQPINFYAFTKLAGEAYATDKDLVIRTSLKPIKPWAYSKAFDDLYTSADYVDVIAEKISFLVSNKARGIFNVGTERKSIYALAKRRNNWVAPMSRNEVSGVKMPVDISLNTEKFDNFYNEVTEGKVTWRK